MFYFGYYAFFTKQEAWCVDHVRPSIWDRTSATKSCLVFFTQFGRELLYTSCRTSASLVKSIHVCLGQNKFPTTFHRLIGRSGRIPYGMFPNNSTRQIGAPSKAQFTSILKFRIYFPIWVKFGVRHIRVHIMLLSICDFRENVCLEKSYFQMGVNILRFTRVLRKSMTFWKLRTS